MAREDDVLVPRDVGVDLVQDLPPLGVVHAVSALGLGRPVVAVMVVSTVDRCNVKFSVARLDDSCQRGNTFPR